MISNTKDPNTILLLHGDSLEDSSMQGHTVINSGVTVSDAQSKFGGKSLYFNGASKLQIPANAMFNFGTGDWTFEAWVYPLTSNSDNLFICGTASGALFIGRISDNSKMGIGRASVAWDIQTASTLTKNAWNHFACVKASGKVYIFVNGILAHSENNTQSYGMAGGAMDIGCMNNNFYYTGYMDEVRLSNVARWTADFNPPTAPYAGDVIITEGGIIPKKYALRRRMMAGKKARLPKEYQEVEYIQSSGTQYINTGFKPNNNTRTVMDLELLSSADIPFIFGVWSGSIKNAYSVYWWTSSHAKWGVDYGTQRQVIEQTVWAERLTVDLNKNVFTVKDVSYILTAATFTAPNTLTLLALNGSSALQGYYAKAKLYGCKIYDNGTLIRNYVPCYRVSDSAAGLYDLANGAFYANAGTGSFAVGADV